MIINWLFKSSELRKFKDIKVYLIYKINIKLKQINDKLWIWNFTFMKKIKILIFLVEKFIIFIYSILRIPYCKLKNPGDFNTLYYTQRKC